MEKFPTKSWTLFLKITSWKKKKSIKDISMVLNIHHNIIDRWRDRDLTITTTVNNENVFKLPNITKGLKTWCFVLKYPSKELKSNTIWLSAFIKSQKFVI